MWRIDLGSGAVAPGWSTWRIALLVASMALAIAGSWSLSFASAPVADVGPCEDPLVLDVDSSPEVHEVELIDAPDQNPAR
jgi:hypothetical protein